ncbi:Fur-regulated basic protein FbpA [Anoxybacteroides tepidamans]|nr:Fur-regulated basic protein FbpA [Anoxybacillus tepidamans]
MRRAILKQKQFYIYELIKTGFFDSDSLYQWTISELRHEYERSVGRRKRKRGDHFESASS